MDNQRGEGRESNCPTSLILSELFGERELEYFGVVPQSILNSLGEILLSQYVDTNAKLLKETLPSKCHTFLSQSQIEAGILQWSEIFESKLDDNFMRFEDYVFDKSILAVPPQFVLPNYAHLMKVDVNEEELDAEIKIVSERLKATAFVNDQLDRELELLAHEELQLNSLEERFKQLSSILASHNCNLQILFPSLVIESIEQATYSLDQQAKHLNSLVTEMLDLRSAHLFAQEDAKVPANSDMDEFEAYSQHQQRQLLMAIGGQSMDPYVEEWTRYSTIATLEDIATLTAMV